MKVLLSWLDEYGDFADPDDDAAVQRLADTMTALGLAVEGIDRVGDTVDGVVTARVLRLETAWLTTDRPRARFSWMTDRFTDVCLRVHGRGVAGGSGSAGSPVGSWWVPSSHKRSSSPSSWRGRRGSSCPAVRRNAVEHRPRRRR